MTRAAPPADAARLLAEAHAARGALGAERPQALSLSAHALWTHARRAPGAPVDFAVVRALRSEPATAARYRTMLSGLAVAHAPFAVAASDGAIRERRVGPYTLTLSPAEDGAPPLLVIATADGKAPAIIEIARPEVMLRLALPAPVAGAIVIALDPAAPDAEGFADAFADPASEIFLL